MNPKIVVFEDKLIDFIHRELEDVSPKDILEYFGPEGRLITDILEDD